MLRLYAKMSGKKRFYAVDMVHGVIVANLIDASIFPDEALPELRKSAESLNPGVLFQIRDGHNKVLQEYRG